MASTPEKKVKDKVVSILKSEGVYYFFPATHGFGRSGVPDIVCCVDGAFLAIECKAGGNKPTTLQTREIDAIRNNKGVAIVVDEKNWDIVRGVVRHIRQKKAHVPDIWEPSSGK